MRGVALRKGRLFGEAGRWSTCGMAHAAFLFLFERLEEADLGRLHNPDGMGRKVFVADDDDDLRALVVETLRSDGYAVVEARDGAELLSMLREALADPAACPDIVVADVRMPHLSGLGVLEQLKRAQVRVPVLMMTGFSPRSVEIVAKRLGATGVLEKPFDADDLRMAVMNARRGST